MMENGRVLSLIRALWFAACSCSCGDVQNPAVSFPTPSASTTTPSPVDASPKPPPAPPETCDAGDPAFVRRATLALLGRRPLGQGEVDAQADAIAQIRSTQAAAGTADTARRLVARAMMQDGAFLVRWSDFLKDSLRIARTQGKSQASCYGDHESVPLDGGALARFVRDHEASASAPPVPRFTMRELLASALELDDLSVVYRAHLFAMMNKPLTGNSLELELERARRNDFGAAFEATYTRRDVSCLGCHNSEYSVSARSDPEANHFWPIPARFEHALFGASSGMHPPEEAAAKGSDVLRARGMFRFTGVVGSGAAPFGWSAACGTFAPPASDDPLHVDTWFGSIRSAPQNPSLGKRASVLELERSLHRGIEALVAQGLPMNGGDVAPDKAFAALVALNIVDNVWTEVIGTRLTIAHSFPRTAVQRDLLATLTDRFVRTRFSLRELLNSILEHTVFNLKPPSAGCGNGPYPLERLFDPWSDSELDLQMRGNGPSDGVFPLSPRVLRRSLHVAMGWPPYPEYPLANSEEETLALALGFFLRDGDPGRRGLDFQGRLAWEAAYGSCAALSEDDFIAKLAASARKDPTATAFDAVVALKDRLIGDPRISDAERPLLEALLQSPLSSQFPSLESGLRRLCGVLIASPMFMLGGLVPDNAREVPKLTPPEAARATACRTLNAALTATAPGTTISCPE